MHSLAFCQGLIEANGGPMKINIIAGIPWHSAKALLKQNLLASISAGSATHSLAFCQGLIEAQDQHRQHLLKFHCIPWHSAKALLKPGKSFNNVFALIMHSLAFCQGLIEANRA